MGRLVKQGVHTPSPSFLQRSVATNAALCIAHTGRNSAVSGPVEDLHLPKPATMVISSTQHDHVQRNTF